jgi:hypothetical protein
MIFFSVLFAVLYIPSLNKNILSNSVGFFHLCQVFNIKNVQVIQDMCIYNVTLVEQRVAPNYGLLC